MVTGSHWEPQLWNPSFASRALPGRHMFASQLAMGKSFTASGAILATPVTRGHQTLRNLGKSGGNGGLTINKYGSNIEFNGIEWNRMGT